MSRKVFYSFNFDRDSQRAAQVRNSHAIADQDEYGVIDSVAWEEVEKKGEQAIKNWIDDQMKYTSATVVLVGSDTAGRKWVDYEIKQSWTRGNGLVAVRIHNVKKLDGTTDVAGPNPLDSILLTNGAPLSSVCKIYDWVANDGLHNLGQWVEESVQIRTNYQGEKTLKDGTTKGLISPSVRQTTPGLINPTPSRTAPNTGFVPHSPHSDYANGER